MSDYIESLEQALRDAAVREYQTPTGRAQGRRRWSTLGVLLAAALLASGSAAAAIATFLDTGSAPLTGAVPGITAQLLRYDIPITPDLEPGNAGWCSEPRFSIKNGAADTSGGGTCSPAASPDAPVILAGGEPISNERDLLARAHRRLTNHEGQIGLFWMVVSSRVAAVRLRPGDVVSSRRDPRLPAGWRAVVAFAPGLSSIGSNFAPLPLDRTGHPIVERPPVSSLESLSSGGVTATRSYDPAGTAPTPCSIQAVHRSSVTAQWEVVATRAPALGPAVAGNVLFSCARSWFSIRGQSQAPSAAVLLDAQDPRHSAPPLPGLKPAGSPGVFIDASAQIVARRVGRAWLVVQGQSVALSRMLLSSLRVGGTLMAAPARPTPGSHPGVRPPSAGPADRRSAGPNRRRKETPAASARRLGLTTRDRGPRSADDLRTARRGR